MGCLYNSKGKPIPITPRNGKAWCDLVNKPGVLPKPINNCRRYRITPDGSWQEIKPTQ